MRALLVVVLLAGSAAAHRHPRVPPAPVQSDRAVIREVVKKHLQKILFCFEVDGLQTTKVQVDFTVGASGKVTATSTKSAGSPSLQRCVADVFAKMTFPRQTGPVHVSYPVHICVAGQ